MDSVDFHKNRTVGSWKQEKDDGLVIFLDHPSWKSDEIARSSRNDRFPGVPGGNARIPLIFTRIEQSARGNRKRTTVWSFPWTIIAEI